MTRPTKAIINLDAIKHNLALMKNIASDSKVVSVVKADAYGNGAIKVAKAIEAQSDILAVAIYDEAVELIEYEIHKPILILQGPYDQTELASAKTQNIIWMVHAYWQLEMINSLPTNVAKPKIWLKFDTGMHRLGFPINQVDRIVNDYSNCIDQDTVFCSHLACADELVTKHADHQIEEFFKYVSTNKYELCIANSAAHIGFENTRLSYVRLGIALYGARPAEHLDIELLPANSLESSIIAIREIPKGDSVGYGASFVAKRPTKIATVAIGYADGYPRHAKNGTPAWCNGQIIHLAGRVSMDMLTFDVSHLETVEVGDTVQLWGDKLDINRVAKEIGTIAYELMTRLSKRVPRFYV